MQPANTPKSPGRLITTQSPCLIIVFSYVDYLHAVRLKLSRVAKYFHTTFSNHIDQSSLALECLCAR